MSADNREAFAHHVGKWQRREPEMAWVEVFCPLPQRQRFRAWGALLYELREAVFELSDARVTTAKTGWWAETLLALAQGQGRHPLTESLAEATAPWSQLARALIEAAQYDGRPGDVAQAIDSVLPLANALAAVEAALFDAQPVPASGDAIAVHLLLQRLPYGLADADAARIPLHLLARHGVTDRELATVKAEPLLRDWASELGAALPARLPEACLYRRLRRAFDAARLQRLVSGQGFAPAPAVWSVWRGWRAARSG